MLFSIVIPVYNVEKYLDECLQSILCQINMEMEDCEIILVDDGSTDKSGIICDEYQEKYPNLIRVFHNTNHGLLFTRRYGYKRAKGEYIINCDSDDCVEKNMLGDIRKVIEKYDTPDMILFNYFALRDNKKEVEYTDIFTAETDCRVSKQDVLKEFMLRHSVVSVCGKIYRRSCIDVDKDYTGLAKVNNGEDTLQTIEFFNNAETFVYLNEALYDYRMGSGMTGKYDSNYYFGFKTVLEFLERQNESWKLTEFDKLFAVKVLQTAGRAITQSRYNEWDSIKQQKEYLKKIAEDELLRENIRLMDEVKSELQNNHVVLLKLLSLKMFSLIIAILNLKNKTEKKEKCTK